MEGTKDCGLQIEKLRGRDGYTRGNKSCCVVKLVEIQWMHHRWNAVNQAVIRYPGTCMMDDEIITRQMVRVRYVCILVKVGLLAYGGGS